MKTKLWKNINGYNGIYKISNTGEIYSQPRIIYKPKRKICVKLKGRFLKPYPTKFGHLYCYLYKNNIKRFVYVHQLVFEHFIGILPEGLEIDHKDDNPANNNVNNLRAITHRRNVSLGHKFRSFPTGVYKRKEGKYYSQISHRGKRIGLGTYETVKAAENAYNLKREEFEYALLRIQ